MIKTIKEEDEMINIEFEKYQLEYKENVLLKDYTTLHIGGKANFIISPKKVKDIQICIELLNRFHIKYKVLGKGSNVLALDEGYNGAIILLTDNFSDIERDGTYVKVQAGMTLGHLCQFCLENNLTGLEFACGIPGSVGGAIYMNAGAYNGEMKDVVSSVTYLNDKNEIKTLTRDELDFGYRQSYFSQHSGIILEAVYKLDIGNKDKIQEKMDELMERRYQRQPMNDYSAGSTFKRPNGNYASALIKECKLQGLTIGEAEVSQKHAGFLINKGNASSDDFLKLIEEVQKRVLEQTGYWLEKEVQILE